MGKSAKKYDDLGSRMKRYELSCRTIAPHGMPLILRLDGKAFHTFTSDMARPFDKVFMSAMDETAIYLCQNIQGARLAYVQSDEISILLYNRREAQPWFGNEVEKLLSVSASMASVKLYTHCDTRKLPAFDCRIIPLPEGEVINYFCWRQSDWIRNSIQLVAQSLIPPKQLHKKGCNELLEMIKAAGGDYEGCTASEKYGRFVVKVRDPAEGLPDRTAWESCYDVLLKRRDLLKGYYADGFDRVDVAGYIRKVFEEIACAPSRSINMLEERRRGSEGP